MEQTCSAITALTLFTKFNKETQTFCKGYKVKTNKLSNLMLSHLLLKTSNTVLEPGHSKRLQHPVQEPEIIVSSQTTAGQNEDKLYKSKCGQIIAGHTITVQRSIITVQMSSNVVGQNQVTLLLVKIRSLHYRSNEVKHHRSNEVKHYRSKRGQT